LIDDDFGIAFEIFCLLPISKKKFEVFWDSSFLLKNKMKKELP
jgi:hypothetical protein